MSAIDSLTSSASFSSPTIIPEEDTLAYWWTSEGGTALRLYDYETSEIETVSIDSESFSPAGWEPIIWLGDRFLIQSRPDLYFVDCDGTVEEFPLEDDYTNIVDVDSAARRYLYIYYPEGLGPHGELWQLRVYDAETDERTTLTEHPEQWGHAGFSPDGRWIAYRENPTETFGEDQLVVTDADGTHERTFHIEDATARTRLYGWHPDGQRLLFDDRSTGWYRTGLHDWQADTTTLFGSDSYNEFPLTILPNGERLVTVQFHDGVSTATVYSQDDEWSARRLDLPDGVIEKRTRQDIGAVLAPDCVLLEHETSTRPSRLFTYDLATDEVTPIVDTQTEALRDLDLVEATQVTYESTNGLGVNAVLHRASQSPSPAVVKVHGGPTKAVYRGFDPFAQFLVQEGYTVLQPNYRGSTDQDRAFEEAIQGDQAEGAVDDVAEGARWLAAQDWIDGERLAVFGHSAGAYNAAMQAIRYPDRWQVAISENGGLDRVEVLSDPNQYSLRRLIDDPDLETQESYLRERSPVHRAEDIDCPICLIHGENDPGVEMSRDLVEGLEDRGWTNGEEFRFEVLEDEE